MASGSNVLCTRDLFDFYTTWSAIIFIVSIFAYWHLYSTPNLATRGFVWFTIANAFAVGAVGHGTVSYLENAELFGNEGHRKIRSTDDSMHLLPLIVWLIILCIDTDRIVLGNRASQLFGVAAALFVVIVVTWALVPAHLREKSSKYADTCFNIRESVKDRTLIGFNKVKAVYGRFHTNSLSLGAISAALPVSFFFVLMILVVVARAKKTRNRNARRR
jgi:hypothetical protein